MRTHLSAPIAGLTLALIATMGQAAGPAPTPSGTRTVEQCADGLVWSEELNRCVEAQSSSLTPEERLEAGTALAYAGRVGSAIEVLRAADADDAATQRMLGYAHRKAGRTDAAMKHYQAALSIDPQDALTRSYMGVGLVEAGQRRAARAELERIADITGTGSREYRLLSQALSRGTSY